MPLGRAEGPCSLGRVGSRVRKLKIGVTSFYGDVECLRFTSEVFQEVVLGAEMGGGPCSEDS